MTLDVHHPSPADVDPLGEGLSARRCRQRASERDKSKQCFTMMSMLAAKNLSIRSSYSPAVPTVSHERDQRASRKKSLYRFEHVLCARPPKQLTLEGGYLPSFTGAILLNGLRKPAPDEYEQPT